MADPVSVQQVVAATITKFDRMDVLVNNAGNLDDFSGAAECSQELWNRVLAVNLTVPFNLTKAAIQQFEKQIDGAPGGVIINICSTAATYGGNAGAAYTASKHGLLGLSKNRAFRYSEKDIYIIAMTMGGMSTNVSDGIMAGQLDRVAFARAQAAGLLASEKDYVPL